MFGWIENGGGVDRYFNNTDLRDVVFHTQSFNNNLVIGNGEGNLNAALYVSSNCVGVRKLPNTNYSLDVAGTMCVQDEILFINNNDPAGKIVLNNTGVSMSRSGVDKVYFDTFGILKSTTVISDNVKTRKISNYLVTFNSIREIEQGYVAEMDIVYAERIETDDILSINNRLYLVINAFSLPEQNKLVVQFNYLLEEHKDFPLELVINQVYTIDILVDMLKSVSNTDYIYIPVYVQAFELEDTYTLSIDVRILDMANRSFLIPENYYHLKKSNTRAALNAPVENIVRLSYFQFWNDDVSVTLKFTSVDGVTPIMDLFGSILSNYEVNMPLYLFKLDTLAPKNVQEVNVSWGYFVGPDNQKRIALKASDLVDYINPPEYAVKVLSSISFDTPDYTLTYEVDSCHVKDGNVIINVPGLNDDPLTAMEARRGMIYYSYLANPVPVKAAQLIDDYTIEYTVRNIYNFMTDLYRYVDAYAFVIDQTRELWKIKRLVVTSVESYVHLTRSSGAPLNEAYLLEPRVIYMLPFKVQAITLLGDKLHDSYVNGSLGVGTNLVNDKLTVAGGVTLYNQVTIFDNVNKNTSTIYYANDCLSLYSRVHIRPESFSIDRDTYIDGMVQAKDYMSVSDRNLKKMIKPASPDRDLANLLKLKIKNFQFTDDRKRMQRKGVIAQEIEKQYPSIVDRSEGYIPNIFKKGYINRYGKQVSLIGNFTSILGKGTKVKYSQSGTESYLVVDSVKYDARSKITRILLQKKLSPRSFIHVYGTLKEFKTIDKDYLFMMAINAIKSLAKQVYKLESRK